jgi:hypothetical protein
MRLKGRIAGLVIAKVREQLLQAFGESLILRVGIKLVTNKSELVNNAVGMASVTLTKENVSMIVELIPLLGSSVLHDKPLLFETSSDVGVDLFEPVLQRRVLIGITINGIDRVK